MEKYPWTSLVNKIYRLTEVGNLRQKFLLEQRCTRLTVFDKKLQSKYDDIIDKKSCWKTLDVEYITAQETIEKSLDEISSFLISTSQI